MLKRTKIAIASIATILTTGTAVQAGGMAEQIMEAPVVADPVEVAPATGSVPGWVIPVAILAVLIGVASSSDSDGENEKRRSTD